MNDRPETDAASKHASPNLPDEATVVVIEALDSLPHAKRACQHAAADHDSVESFGDWLFELLMDLSADEWDGNYRVLTALAECDRAALATHFFNRSWRSMSRRSA
jgi:hypothetical protein